jgi:2-oxoglutarate dehydrogenase E1 component
LSHHLPTPEIGSHNLAFVEALYADYLADPASVPEVWRDVLAGWARSNGQVGAQIGPSFPPRGLYSPRGTGGVGAGAGGTGVAGTAADDGCASNAEVEQAAEAQSRVDQLIRSYRVRGHNAARLDPLGLSREVPAELDPAYYGFGATDFEREFASNYLSGSHQPRLSLREILRRLENTYARSIGAQFMHIDDLSVRRWLQERMETTENRLDLPRQTQLRILKRLTHAVIFEDFLQKKFLGAKRFSLEGGESLIPLLDLAIEGAAEHGIVEIVIGMAHRGRVNVLHNILGKSASQIFREFSDSDGHLQKGRGDVKYHLGHSAEWIAESGRPVHLSLCFNPSHLEFVNPVALGRLRAKQDHYGDRDGATGMVILIHGDAAFAGQGVVQETLNLSGLAGYSTGGTIHVVLNNQIGFTTDPHDCRSSTYATDVAKMLQIPIFHVNGEDPEAVAQVIALALDFRQRFGRDVVIDMYCYRLYGHNEGDEPAFTQPLMYRAIRARKSVREGYLEHLLELGGLTREEADRIASEEKQRLEVELSVARDEPARPAGVVDMWTGLSGGADAGVAEPETGVAREQLSTLLHNLAKLPQGFQPHPKIVRVLEGRTEIALGKQPVDWSAAEALAFGSLALCGHRVRLTGQDSERGTFSHRHAVLHDYETGTRYMPLAHLSERQAPVEIYNSPLSEIGVLGYEYGYSLDCPQGLVMWEAQFGDFCNVAQVIIDQFLVSAEEKWRRLSGLVLLLPHGFEGQGPEHSSARLERFLALCADDNIQVAQPTTPAQLFHLLRRQVLRPWRKPLVVMTPKSLLRHPRVVSPLEDLANGRFQRILPDQQAQRPRATSRVLVCSGKLYYELVEAREKLQRLDIAILRLEQLYPLDPEHFRPLLETYKANTPVYWVQDEPENMGAWSFLRLRLGDKLLARHPFHGIYRRASASPATGSLTSHKLEHAELVQLAFAGA